MAEMGLFFESINGDRRYKVSELVAYLRPFFSDGVFPNPSTGLQVTESSEKDMFVLVKPGDGWVNGRMYRIVDDAKRLRLDPSDSATTRIDRVVVGCNYKDRVINTYVKKGTPGSVATAPELTRDATVYEISLAEITIAPGAIGITQSAIKDTRLDNDVCGIVTGLVETVDTSTLYNQLEKWKEEYIAKTNTWTDEQEQLFLNWKQLFETTATDWRAGEEQKFIEWFNSIKGKLDGDVGTNLTNRVDGLEERLNTMKLTADNVSINTIQGLQGTNVQEALQNIFNEINGRASQLNSINLEASKEIGNPM